MAPIVRYFLWICFLVWYGCGYGFFVVVVGGLACNKTIGDQREQREKEKQNVVMVNKKS